MNLNTASESRSTFVDSVVDRIFNKTPPTEEPSTDLGHIACQVVEHADYPGQWLMVIPQRIPVEMMTPSKGQNGTPGNVLHVQCEAPSVACEVVRADGEVAKLVTKPIRTRLAFKL